MRVPDISLRELVAYHEGIHGLLRFIVAEKGKGNKEAVKTLARWNRDRTKVVDIHLVDNLDPGFIIRQTPLQHRQLVDT